MGTNADSEVQLRRVPVLLPHVIIDGNQLFDGRTPLGELSTGGIAFCRACDGSSTLAEVLEQHPWSDELDEIVEYLVWLDRPIDLPPDAGTAQERTLLVSPQPEVGLISLAGWLHRRRGRHHCTHLIACSRLAEAEAGEAFPSLIELSAIRRDEAELAARALGCRNTWLGFSQIELRHAEFTGELFDRREECVGRSLRLALHTAISRLAPDHVYAPAAIAAHPDHRFLFEAVLDLYKEGCFPDTRFHFYEEVPQAASYLGVDDFLSRFEKAYVDLEDGFEDISEGLNQKLEVLRIFRSAFEPAAVATVVEIARRNAVLARRRQPAASSATAVERSWTLRDLRPRTQRRAAWT